MHASVRNIVAASAIALVLGLSAVLAWIHLLCVIRFDVGTAATDVVRNDFVAFHAAAQFAAEGEPQRAYDLRALHDRIRAITGNDDFPALSAAYPPFLPWLMSPLAALDVVTAYRTWVVATTFAAIAVALRIARRWSLVPVAVLFPAIGFSAAAGQNGNLSAALIGAGLVLLPHRPVAAGVALGLMAYKPQLAIAVPFCLLAGGHLRALAAAALTALATFGVALAAYGAAPIVAFFTNLDAQAGVVLAAPHLWPRMPTPFAQALGGPGPAALPSVLLVSIGALALWGVVRVWRTSTDPVPRSIALTAAMPLLSPYFFDYDLAVMIVPLAFLARACASGRCGAQALLPALALWVAQPWVTLLPAVTAPTWTPALWLLLLAWAVRAAARATATAATPGSGSPRRGPGG